MDELEQKALNAKFKEEVEKIKLFKKALK